MTQPSAGNFDKTIPRVIEAEILDGMADDDPRAVGVRNDLRWINVIMRQTRHLARAMLRYYPGDAPRNILDLGSGDGMQMLQVARRLSRHWHGVTVLLLDRHNIVEPKTIEAFDALGWRAMPLACDVFQVLERSPAPEADIICANLFLHHFDGPTLSRLMAQAARRAKLFVACEPRRAQVGITCSDLSWLIGCNEITRHDAVASVRAGFRSKELTALWPDRQRWQVHEWRASLFTHGFAAVRQS